MLKEVCSRLISRVPAQSYFVGYSSNFDKSSTSITFIALIPVRRSQVSFEPDVVSYTFDEATRTGTEAVVLATRHRKYNPYTFGCAHDLCIDNSYKQCTISCVMTPSTSSTNL